MRVLVSGASGLIGSAIVPFLREWGHDVFCLARRFDETRPDLIYWNPDRKEIKAEELEGFDAVIHLSGENVAQRWDKEVKQKIIESRVNTTEFLVNALLSLASPPKVFIGASAIGYYGSHPRGTVDENSPPGNDFLAKVCLAWERSAESLTAKDMRVVHSRFGIVLSAKGGALKRMLIPFKMGLGGVIGSGEQMMSWISIDDVCRAMHHVLSSPKLAGSINFTAPQPVSNREFTQVLAKRVNRSAWIPIPAFAARWIFGEMGDALLLSSASVFPTRLLQSGFHFQYPDLNLALLHLLQKSL